MPHDRLIYIFRLNGIIKAFLKIVWVDGLDD
jgi:hypothetical protein